MRERIATKSINPQYIINVLDEKKLYSDGRKDVYYVTVSIDGQPSIDKAKEIIINYVKDNYYYSPFVHKINKLEDDVYGFHLECWVN